MTATTGAAQRGRRFTGRLSRFWAAISAVSIKELRGRMRGRRAFVVLTVYLLLLGLFSFGVYFYLKQQAATGIASNPVTEFPGMPFPGGQTLSNGTALSAAIGHAIFSGLLMVETLLVLVLAPAFTTGAISLEREKQTLDLLVTTPLSTLGMVIGKLFSALTYVFLLILASIPFASLVFVFGGVGPEDLVRAYAFLFALAFGMGASRVSSYRPSSSALRPRRWSRSCSCCSCRSAPRRSTSSGRSPGGRQPRAAACCSANAARAPEALVWLNPFVANLDMVCATAPDAYHQSCEYISAVTGRPYFGSPTPTTPVFPGRDGGGVVEPGVIVDDVNILPMPQAEPPVDQPACPPNADCVLPGGGGVVGVAIGVPGDPGAGTGTNEQITFGFPRDTFWPKSAAAFVVLGIVLTLLSAQLVSPSRRLHLPRLRRRAADRIDHRHRRRPTDRH